MNILSIIQYDSATIRYQDNDTPVELTVICWHVIQMARQLLLQREVVCLTQQRQTPFSPDLPIALAAEGLE